MKSYIIYFLLLVVISEIFTIIFINKDNSNKKILAEETQIIETSEPTYIPTTTPNNTPEIEEITPTPKPTPIKTKSPKPQPKYSSSEINSFIDRFAAQYGVSADILRHIAICESGFNPSATHLSYAGLYQFGPTTWKNIRNEFGEDVNFDLRFNAEEAVQTAAFAISKNKTGIWPNCYP